jgi:alpha-L-arabinofuranosidase
LSRGKTHDRDAAKGDAVQFDLQDWYEVFREGGKVENIMLSNWDVLVQYDPDHNVQLVVDEYGTWYKPGNELDASHNLGQQITFRDALLTAQTLDIFNRHAEKMGIGACAQLINCLNSVFLSHEDKFVVTPNFFVFDMCQSHQGATAVRAEFSAPHKTPSGTISLRFFWGPQRLCLSQKQDSDVSGSESPRNGTPGSGDCGPRRFAFIRRGNRSGQHRYSCPQHL